MPDTKLIINLVDQYSKVNFGIWHAAIATAEALKIQHGIDTMLVAPRTKKPFDAKRFPFVQFQSVEDLSLSGAEVFFSQWDPKTTVIATHGTWQFPTRWGAEARKQGFRWIYTPHGMLEPWSMSQKWLKKRLYFEFAEKPMARKADWVRAVGSPEEVNLKKHFKQVKLIPNAVYATDLLDLPRPATPTRFLYLARLHHKKGILPLVEAWKTSLLWKNADYQLNIAGTDDGEQAKLEKFLSENPGGNIHFLGPQFGADKTKLLKESHYYILPSLSEGFPTSVLEAMAAGLVPVITKGCNFPESLAKNLALETYTSTSEISQTLDEILQITEAERLAKAIQCQAFVKENYVWDQIAAMQAELVK